MGHIAHFPSDSFISVGVEITARSVRQKRMKVNAWVFWVCIGAALALGIWIGYTPYVGLPRSELSTPAGVASSVKFTGELCVKALDECVASNRECVVMLKESVSKADDYLQILEKASGKNLHRDAGRD
jgi:hypothetical protein